jgi:predicted homoserine dehydrogenase-like protein
MLVVDLLQEFELGVWKAVFTQLLRMLECLEESKVHELDRRSVFCPYVIHSFNSFLQISPIPTFRQDTICHFSRNVSEMKRTAAHDFEDLLQVGHLICYFRLIS